MTRASTRGKEYIFRCVDPVTVHSCARLVRSPGPETRRCSRSDSRSVSQTILRNPGTVNKSRYQPRIAAGLWSVDG